MRLNLSIVIPAYNEGKSIGHVLENLLPFCMQTDTRVVVVDDGSRDDTYNQLQIFKAKYPEFQLRILRHSLNKGYGGALKTGIRAVETQYVITLDADGQHRPEDIPVLYQKLKQERAALCIGNRQGKGSSFSRNLVKAMILSVVKKSTGIQINDLNSGMKLYKTAIVQSLLKYTSNGMPFSDSIVLLHHQFRYRIIEEQITVLDRTEGESTINYKTAIYTLVEIANIIINFFPFRFFCSLAILFFSIGLLWGVPLILDGHGMSTGMSFLMLASMNFVFFGIILENVVRSRFENYQPVLEE